MRLIRLAVVLALSLFATLLGAEGQRVGKVFRIGILFNASPAENPSVSAFAIPQSVVVRADEIIH